MPTTLPYNQLSYKSKWMKWKREPNKYPHPGKPKSKLKRWLGRWKKTTMKEVSFGRKPPDASTANYKPSSKLVWKDGRLVPKPKKNPATTKSGR